MSPFFVVESETFAGYPLDEGAGADVPGLGFGPMRVTIGAVGVRWLCLFKVTGVQDQS